MLKELEMTYPWPRPTILGSSARIITVSTSVLSASRQREAQQNINQQSLQSELRPAYTREWKCSREIRISFWRCDSDCTSVSRRRNPIFTLPVAKLINTTNYIINGNSRTPILAGWRMCSSWRLSYWCRRSLPLVNGNLKFTAHFTISPAALTNQE